MMKKHAITPTEAEKQPVVAAAQKKQGFIKKCLVGAQEALDQNEIFISRSELLMAESLLGAWMEIPGPANKKKLLDQAHASFEKCIRIFNENITYLPNRPVDEMEVSSPQAQRRIAEALAVNQLFIENLFRDHAKTPPPATRTPHEKV